MNLIDFKKELDRIIEYAKECDEDLKDINVSIQIDDYKGHTKFSDDLELHYDNNCQTSGFVILGLIDKFNF